MHTPEKVNKGAGPMMMISKGFATPERKFTLKFLVTTIACIKYFIESKSSSAINQTPSEISTVVMAISTHTQCGLRVPDSVVE